MSEMNCGNDTALLVYGTCPDAECAKAIAKLLLERRLVACVNILPGMMSLYRWQGSVEEDSEVVFVAKTRQTCWPALSECFASLHPYDEPALVALPVSAGLPGFLSWIAKETVA